MNKLSVIIPTVQKGLKVTNKLLAILDNDESISEIILINNRKEKFFPEHTIEKLKIFNQKENLYVNKSWNFGITICENERFLIMNDDILCPAGFPSKIISSGILELENTGLVGLCNRFINQNNRGTVDDLDIPNDDNITPDFLPISNYMGTGDWGSAFFGKKSSYYMIPDDINIIYGDNYLLYKNIKTHIYYYLIQRLICIVYNLFFYN